MKGISPLIASVLLIAFTVAVGGIISLWLTSYSKTMTSGAEQSSKGAAECAGAYFDILSVDITNKNLVVRNAGSTNANVTSVSDDKANVHTFNPPIELTGGETQNLTSITELDPSATKVVVTGLCIPTVGNPVSITGECTQGQSCWS